MAILRISPSFPILANLSHLVPLCQLSQADNTPCSSESFRQRRLHPVSPMLYDPQGLRVHWSAGPFPPDNVGIGKIRRELSLRCGESPSSLHLYRLGATEKWSRFSDGAGRRLAPRLAGRPVLRPTRIHDGPVLGPPTGNLCPPERLTCRRGCSLRAACEDTRSRVAWPRDRRPDI
jgi:hypothetical protein